MIVYQQTKFGLQEKEKKTKKNTPKKRTISSEDIIAESECGVFEANCSKQMGQRKKKIFHRMFLCLHEG